MSKPRVLLTRRIPSSALRTLEDRCDVDRNEGGPLSTTELLARVRGQQGIVCLMTDAITADVMDAGSDLKVIANVAVGYNNIDVPAARGRGIIVTNTPDVVTEAPADLAWALIEDEPNVHPELMMLEHVVLVPHVGSATTETRTAMADLAVRNTIAVLTGRAPITPVP